MQVIDIEQGSYEWHCLRHGKVTGTTLKSALGTKRVQETLLNKLIAERMTEPQIDDINTTAISRGREMEPLARKAVIEETGLEFTETGMLMCESLPDFAMSPDGVYIQDGTVIGGLEIKCPDSKKHVEYLRGDGVPMDYWHQVMAPFLISKDVQWWVFASYDDRNYERPLYLTTVKRDDFPDLSDDWDKLYGFLRTVRKEHERLTF